MSCVIEHLDVRKHGIVVSDHNKENNEWYDDEEVVFQSPRSKKYAKEIEECHQFT